MVNRKEPEPQFVISVPAPGGNLILARLRLDNTATYPGNLDESVQRPVEVLGPVVPLAVADLLGGVEGGEEGRVTVHPRAEVIHQPVAVHKTLLPEHHALRLQPAI